MKKTFLEPEQYYHIYNRANGNDKLFKEVDNFNFFMKKYSFHIQPIAETIAYCLIPNHFHFLVKIKSEKVLANTFPKFISLEKSEQTYFISKQFSNLFSSYTQSFNKINLRKGSLFMKNFKRKQITSKLYIQQLVLYIHNNPVKHNLTKRTEEWQFSSYNSYLSNRNNILKQSEILDYFENFQNFIYCHQQHLKTL